MIEIILPWPPSVNNYKKIGKIVKTAKGKLYQQRINSNETKMFYFQVYILAKKLKRPESELYCFRDDISLEATVCLYPPHQKRYDLDNRLKVLMDSLMHARIIHDDSQISRLIVEKKGMIESGQTIVTIKEIT